jgi:hypothetical protein
MSFISQPFPELQMRFEDQQREIYFPVLLDYMQAIRTWELLDPNETIEIAGVRVQMMLLSHPGGAYSYRFTCNGKVLVYATDGEYHRMDAESTARYVEFFRGADMLIFDAQYPFEQAIDAKRDWGHSTPKMEPNSHSGLVLSACAHPSSAYGRAALNPLPRRTTTWPFARKPWVSQAPET